jgi:hypothetical protein
MYCLVTSNNLDINMVREFKVRQDLTSMGNVAVALI